MNMQAVFLFSSVSQWAMAEREHLDFLFVCVSTTAKDDSISDLIWPLVSLYTRESGQVWLGTQREHAHSHICTKMHINTPSHTQKGSVDGAYLVLWSQYIIKGLYHQWYRLVVRLTSLQMIITLPFSAPLSTPWVNLFYFCSHPQSKVYPCIPLKKKLGLIFSVFRDRAGELVRVVLKQRLKDLYYTIETMDLALTSFFLRRVFITLLTLFECSTEQRDIFCVQTVSVNHASWESTFSTRPRFVSDSSLVVSL